MERSSGGVIFNKNKFLLLKYSAGHWSFVKGHIEKGENIKQTFFRETKEETGLKKENLKLIPDFKEKINYFYKRNRKTIYKEVVYLLAESNSQKVTLSHEHTDYKWLEYDNALEKVTFDNAKQVLKKAKKTLRK